MKIKDSPPRLLCKSIHLRGSFASLVVRICRPIYLNGLSDQFNSKVSHSGKYVPSSIQEWMPEIVWTRVTALTSFGKFLGLLDEISNADDAWHAWYDSEMPETLDIPGTAGRWSPFQKLCIVKVRISNHKPLFIRRCRRMTVNPCESV